MKKFFLTICFLCSLVYAEESQTTQDNINYIKSEIHDINQSVSYIEVYSNNIKNDVNTIKTNTDTIKSYLSTIKSTTSTLPSDLENINLTLSGIESTSQNIFFLIEEGFEQNNQNLTNLYYEVNKLQTKITDLKTNIQTNHQELYELLSTSFSTINTSIYNLQASVNNIQSALTNIVQKLDNLYLVNTNILQYVESSNTNLVNLVNAFGKNWSYYNTRAWYALSSGVQDYTGIPTMQARSYDASANDFSSYLSQNINALFSVLQNASKLDLNRNYRIYDLQSKLAQVVKLLDNGNGSITNDYKDVAQNYEDNVVSKIEGAENTSGDIVAKFDVKNSSVEQIKLTKQDLINVLKTLDFQDLPQNVEIQLQNFRLGQNQTHEYSIINIEYSDKHIIIFKIIRACSKIIIWGILLFLAYKVSLFFINFISSKSSNLLISTNKSHDGSFL